MTVAITIGAYKLSTFVHLNVLRCRRLLPGVPILISEDRSPESEQIEALADELECDYVCSPKRRSHFSGDWNHIANSLVFAKEIGAEVAVKLSQRCVPVLPEFFTVLDQVFADPEVQIGLPGRLNPNQIVHPESRFFKKFGVMSDMLAFRVGAIDPEEMLAIYRTRNETGRPHDSFSETSIGYLLSTRFPGRKACIIPQWTNHEQGKPKLFLRKAQSPASHYAQVAMMESVESPTGWDTREWKSIEGKQYRPKADVV